MLSKNAIVQYSSLILDAYNATCIPITALELHSHWKIQTHSIMPVLRFIVVDQSV